MKYIVLIARVLVAALFIFSGFIKLNDPLGFSYKLQEYFGADVLNLPFLIPYALILAIFVVVFEVILGVFLLIGYKPKFTVWSLLAMIVFFTFLTFYSAYYEKVADCGCFGDAFKDLIGRTLKPWESFKKDVVLLVLIIIILFGLRHIKPVLNKFGLTIVALLSFVGCLGFAYFVLMHLPAIDFRPYKVGNNLQEQMSTPPNAQKPIIEYNWKFNVNGEEKIFTTMGDYPTVDGDYVSVDYNMVEEGFVPAIQDFSIESDDENLTDQFLAEPKLVMIVMYDLTKGEWEGVEKLKSISESALKKGYTVIGLTSSGGDAKERFKTEHNLNFDFYLCDEKVLKTIVRANPGIVVLNKGTVTQKKHWNDADELEFK